MKVNKADAATAVQGIEGDEVYVFSAKEHTDLLENFKKTTIETELKSRIAKVYDDVDADFKNVLGVDKPADQKTYKYWPEMAKQLKEKSEAAAAEIDKLKSGANPEVHKELEALRKAAQEKDAEWKQKIESMQKELTTKDIKNNLDQSTRSMKFIGIPKPVLDTYIESAKNKLASTAKVVDGKIQFTGADGNPLLNKETMLPYTAEEMMKMELDQVIDKGNQNKGGGTEKPTITKDKDGKLDILVTIPQTVRNRQELTKFLIESGLPHNTPEHNAAYDKYSVNLPIK